MAKYIIVNKAKMLEKGIITEDTVRRTNATKVILLEDDLKKYNAEQTIEETAEELEAVVLTHAQALLEMEKPEWNENIE